MGKRDPEDTLFIEKQTLMRALLLLDWTSGPIIIKLRMYIYQWPYSFFLFFSSILWSLPCTLVAEMDTKYIAVAWRIRELVLCRIWPFERLGVRASLAQYTD
jgi:hypothetical protein